VTGAGQGSDAEAFLGREYDDEGFDGLDL